jgi:hypothetical protein
MQARNRTWVISFAAGSALGAAIYIWEKNRRRPGRARPTRFTRDRSQVVGWRFDNRFRALPAGRALRIEAESPVIVHWTANQWDAVEDTRSREVEPGVHAVELPTGELKPGTRVQFTFYWPLVKRWEGEDFEVRVEEATERTVRSATEMAD